MMYLSASNISKSSFKTNTRISFSTLFLSVLIVISMTPFLVRNCPRFIIIASIIGWIVSSFVEKRIPFKNNKYNLILFCTFLFVLVDFLYYFSGYSDAAIGNYMMHSICYIFILAALTILEDKRHSYKFIIALIALIALINVVSNIVISIKYPDAFMDINNWPEKYSHTNVAQTWFYFACVLLVGFLLILFTISKKNTHRFFLIVSVLLVLYFLFFCGARATSAILVVSLMLAFIFVRLFIKKKYFLLSFVLIILLILLLFSNSLLDFVETMIGPSRLTERIDDIRLLLSGEANQNGSLFGRTQLMQLSLDSFFKSPTSFLFGIGYHVDVDPYAVGIGQHSTFIDCLAQYGIIFSFLFFYIIFSSCFAIARKVEFTTLRPYVIVMCVVFILYGFVNVFLHTAIFAVFFIVTASVARISEKECCKL